MANCAVGVAEMGQEATRIHIVVEEDKFILQRKRIPKNYNKHLQACIFAVQEMRTIFLSR